MKVLPGFSICQHDEYEKFIQEDGFVETDELDKAGLPWRWNEGDDGPALAGPNWEPTVSVVTSQEVTEEWAEAKDRVHTALAQIRWGHPNGEENYEAALVAEKDKAQRLERLKKSPLNRP